MDLQNAYFVPEHQQLRVGQHLISLSSLTTSSHIYFFSLQKNCIKILLSATSQAEPSSWKQMILFLLEMWIVY